MFENIDSAKPGRHWLLWGSLKAIGLGIACFLLAFFLSLLITIPWSQHYWAGEAQAELGGLVLSFYFGIASGIAAAVYILRRIIRSNR
jgi:nitrate reductase gamma subunit